MATLSTYYPTLLDVARALDPNGRIAMVAEVLQQYNDILDDIPWLEGNLPTGTQHTIRTSKPTPTKRLLNQGVAPSKSTTGQIVDVCAIYETQSHIDKNLADMNGNTQAFRMTQDKGMMEGFADALAIDLIYGDSSVTPTAFDGLAPRYFALSGQTTSTNVIDAGGTGSDNTSIWLVCWGPEKVFGVYPKSSRAGLQVEDKGLQNILTDATNNQYMMAYVTWMQWMAGLAIADWRYVVRIANIDVSALLTASDSTDTSANILKLMIRALGKIPPRGGNVRPVFYMNESVQTMLSVKLLDKSNLFLNLSELKGSPVFRPNGTLTFQGVPCRRIDGITSTESALT